MKFKLYTHILFIIYRYYIYDDIHSFLIEYFDNSDFIYFYCIFGEIYYLFIEINNYYIQIKKDFLL